MSKKMSSQDLSKAGVHLRSSRATRRVMVPRRIRYWCSMLCLTRTALTERVTTWSTALRVKFPKLTRSAFWSFVIFWFLISLVVLLSVTAVAMLAAEATLKDHKQMQIVCTDSPQNSSSDQAKPNTTYEEISIENISLKNASSDHKVVEKWMFGFSEMMKIVKTSFLKHLGTRNNFLEDAIVSIPSTRNIMKLPTTLNKTILDFPMLTTTQTPIIAAPIFSTPIEIPILTISTETRKLVTTTERGAVDISTPKLIAIPQTPTSPRDTTSAWSVLTTKIPEVELIRSYVLNQMQKAREGRTKEGTLTQILELDTTTRDLTLSTNMMSTTSLTQATRIPRAQQIMAYVRKRIKNTNENKEALKTLNEELASTTPLPKTTRMPRGRRIRDYMRRIIKNTKEKAAKKDILLLKQSTKAPSDVILPEGLQPKTTSPMATRIPRVQQIRAYVQERIKKMKEVRANNKTETLTSITNKLTNLTTPTTTLNSTTRMPRVQQIRAFVRRRIQKEKEATKNQTKILGTSTELPTLIKKLKR